MAGMATADRILGLIDTGLAEAGTPTAPAYGRKGECDRCDAPADEEVCAGCRAFLLGDSGTDPTISRAGVPEDVIRRRCELCHCPDCERWLASHPVAASRSRHEGDCDCRGCLAYRGPSPIAAEQARIIALAEPLVPRPAEYTGTITLTAGDGITYEVLRELFGMPDRPQG